MTTPAAPAGITTAADAAAIVASAPMERGRLSLSGQHIKDLALFVPSLVARQPTELDLSHTGLVALPTDLSDLASVVELDIRANPFAPDWPWKGLSSMPSLTRLRLDIDNERDAEVVHAVLPRVTIVGAPSPPHAESADGDAPASSPAPPRTVFIPSGSAQLPQLGGDSGAASGGASAAAVTEGDLTGAAVVFGDIKAARLLLLRAAADVASAASASRSGAAAAPPPPPRRVDVIGALASSTATMDASLTAAFDGAVTRALGTLAADLAAHADDPFRRRADVAAARGALADLCAGALADALSAAAAVAALPGFTGAGGAAAGAVANALQLLYGASVSLRAAHSATARSAVSVAGDAAAFAAASHADAHALVAAARAEARASATNAETRGAALAGAQDDAARLGAALESERARWTLERAALSARVEALALQLRAARGDTATAAAAVGSRQQQHESGLQRDDEGGMAVDEGGPRRTLTAAQQGVHGGDGRSAQHDGGGAFEDGIGGGARGAPSVSAVADAVAAGLERRRRAASVPPAQRLGSAGVSGGGGGSRSSGDATSQGMPAPTAEPRPYEAGSHVASSSSISSPSRVRPARLSSMRTPPSPLGRARTASPPARARAAAQQSPQQRSSPEVPPPRAAWVSAASAGGRGRGSPMGPDLGSRGAWPASSQLLPLPAAVPRVLPLAALRADVHALQESKLRADVAADAARRPRPTLEEHLYVWLRLRADEGARAADGAAAASISDDDAIVAYASALVRAAEAYARIDVSASILRAVLHGDVDDGFLNVERTLRASATRLLQRSASAKGDLQDIDGDTIIPESRWGGIVDKLYTAADAPSAREAVRDAVARATISSAYPPADYRQAQSPTASPPHRSPSLSRGSPTASPSDAGESSRRLSAAARVDSLLASLANTPGGVAAAISALNPTSSLPASAFVDALVRFQLRAHEAYVAPLAAAFRAAVGVRGDGLLSPLEFARLISKHTEPPPPPGRVAALVRGADPFDTGRISLSDCVRALQSSSSGDQGAAAPAGAAQAGRGATRQRGSQAAHRIGGAHLQRASEPAAVAVRSDAHAHPQAPVLPPRYLDRTFSSIMMTSATGHGKHATRSASVPRGRG